MDEVPHDPKSAIELDTCGLLCPLPVLKARKRLKSMAEGEVLRVLSDDEGSLQDFRHFCEVQQHRLLEQTREGREGRVLCHVISKGQG